MQINLSKEECQNVKVALLSMAKSSQVNEIGMKMLLNLSDKFTVKEEVIPEKK